VILIENPDYVIQNNLKLDYLHYLEKQIIKPASQILELMLTEKSVEKLFAKYIYQEKNRRNNVVTVDNWLTNKYNVDFKYELKSKNYRKISSTNKLENIIDHKQSKIIIPLKKNTQIKKKKRMVHNYANIGSLLE
jgi:hypothetical protein